MKTSSNVHTTEIHTFDQLSEDWWNPEGAFRTLHDINATRLNFITAQVDLDQKKILDIGCGGGILTESLYHQGAIATGIDASASAVICAQQHAKAHEKEITYVCTTAEAFSEEYVHEFDVVVCMELLEHVPNPLSVIQACARLLKPEGYVFFSTLNRNLKSYVQAILGAEYILKLLPKGLHHYNQFIKPSELTTWMRQSQLMPLKITGLSYHPFSRTCTLIDSPAVNYLVSGKAQL